MSLRNKQQNILSYLSSYVNLFFMCVYGGVDRIQVRTAKASRSLLEHRR